MRFFDIVKTAIDYGHRAPVTIELVKLMQNSIEQLSAHNPLKDIICKELDYIQLFSLFVQKRKINLLRFMFSLPTSQFSGFSIQIFIKCLELEAIDIAALLYKEFFRLIRMFSPHEEEVILTSIISSFAKSNGMLEFKCYLVRQFSERMLQRHARRLFDTLDLKI